MNPGIPRKLLKLAVGQRLMDGFYASRDSIRTVLLLPAFHRWGNCSWKRISNFVSIVCLLNGLNQASDNSRMHFSSLWGLGPSPLLWVWEGRYRPLFCRIIYLSYSFLLLHRGLQTSSGLYVQRILYIFTGKRLPPIISLTDLFRRNRL